MGEKLRRFMAGRYGIDALNKLIFGVTLVLILAMWFWPNRLLELIVLALLLLGYFRCFSRNIRRRYAENQRYLNLTVKPRKFLRKIKSRFEQRKSYRFYKCPRCKQEIRVPKGKGKIKIRCPKCQEQFIKKS